MKQTVSILALLFLFTTSALTLHGQDTPVITQELEKLLNADGTINTSTGYTGTVDGKGWDVRLAPDGTPHFFRDNDPGKNGSSAIASVPDDIYWDSRFGVPGVIGAINTIALSGCNDIYVGGEFNLIGGVDARNIARWDGAQWHSLGEGVNGPVYSIAVDDNFTVYAGGDFDSAGTTSANNIAAWNGARWLDLAGGVTMGAQFPTVNAVVHAVSIFQGDAYVGGIFDEAGGGTVNNIAYWDGSRWNAMAEGLTGRFRHVYAIAPAYNGVYVGGSFDRAGPLPLANLAHWDGLHWENVGNGVTGPTGPATATFVRALSVSGGDIYIGGEFTHAGTIQAQNIAVWSSSVNRWFTFGNGSAIPVVALAVSGSKLYASGEFLDDEGEPIHNIARWNGDNWTLLGVGAENEGADSAVTAIAVVGRDVYAGGRFTKIGNIGAYKIAHWNLTTRTWTSLSEGGSFSGGANGTVYAVAITDDYVYIGGRFSSVGKVLANSLARWNRNTGLWSSLGGGVEIKPATSDMLLPTVFAIATHENDVYVGGQFNRAGGIVADNVAKWSGGVWSALGSGIGYGGTPPPNADIQAVYAIDVSDDGNIVYVGGQFDQAGAQRANRIAQWDNTTSIWSPIGGGIGGSSFNTSIRALAAHGTDVYVGGIFPVAGAIRASNIARWDGTEWHALGSGVNNSVFTITIGQDGTLYAGGEFRVAGGQNANYIASWDGSNWSALGTGTNSAVYDIAISSNGIYVTGGFSIAGTKSPNLIALWSGGDWRLLGSGLVHQQMLGKGYSMDVDGKELFVGGDFNLAGGKPSFNIALWTKPLPEPPPVQQVSSVNTFTDDHESLVACTVYPNPVAGNPTFSITAHKSGWGRLTISASDGTTVATLSEGLIQEGTTEIEWNTTGLPSGPYFYWLRIDGSIQTGRLIIAR